VRNGFQKGKKGNSSPPGEIIAMDMGVVGGEGHGLGS